MEDCSFRLLFLLGFLNFKVWHVYFSFVFHRFCFFIVLLRHLCFFFWILVFISYLNFVGWYLETFFTFSPALLISEILTLYFSFWLLLWLWMFCCHDQVILCFHFGFAVMFCLHVLLSSFPSSLCFFNPLLCLFSFMGFIV